MATDDAIERAEEARFIDDLLRICVDRCRELGREPPFIVVMAGAGKRLLTACNAAEPAMRLAMIEYISAAPERLDIHEYRRPFGPL